MPIYEYKCSSCGHKKEVLQKLSDAPLRECPACGKSTLTKLMSAAGFQLKGSGWYATDFKGGSKSADSGKEDSGKEKDGSAKVEGKAGDEAKVKTETKGAQDNQAKGDTKGKGDTQARGDAKAKGDTTPKEQATSEAPPSSAGASPAGQ